MINRRDFLKAGLRNMIVGGVGIMSGVLLLRSLGNTEESCNYDFLCKNCNKLDRCNLPEGVQFKKVNE